MDNTRARDYDYRQSYFNLEKALINLKLCELVAEKNRTTNPIIALEINAQMKIIDFILDRLIPQSKVLEE